MVSKNPNPGAEGFYIDPTATMTLPGLNPYTSTASVSKPDAAETTDDVVKRVRKPYKITKSRESWTEPEHDKFLEALQLFDRDWKKIEAFVGTKTIKQIRSHAQKYFMKAEKNGTKEYLPPPRPKRKAAYPYPQKAPKTGSAVPPSTQTVSFQSSSSSAQPVFMLTTNSPALLQTAVTDVAMSSWPSNTDFNSSNLTKGLIMVNNCFSSSETTPNKRHKKTDQDRLDFSRVYNFIGSVFDPDVTDHLQRLKSLSPIEVKSVLQLMTNFSINLFSSEFENDRKVLSTYEIELDKTCHDDETRILQSSQSCNAV